MISLTLGYSLALSGLGFLVSLSLHVSDTYAFADYLLLTTTSLRHALDANHVLDVDECNDF